MYRGETFSILAINSWELLLKAKYLKDNHNKMRSLYVMEPITNKDGSKSKKVVMERIRKRKGNHQNDIILTEQTASTYYDHFQPPTAEEGEVIVVEGY